MPADNMTTKEAADYLGINEKQVYALIKSKKIPCTRVTGKWVFPRKLIDKWITENALKSVGDGDRQRVRPENIIYAAGSNDPVLDILLNKIRGGKGGSHIFSSVTGSREGISLLGQGIADIAWCHLSAKGSGEYDMNSIMDFIPDKKIAIVHLFVRELGFIYSGKLKLNSLTFSDVAGHKLRFVNRQEGSGTRLIIEQFMASEGVDPSRIQGFDDAVYTHMEVGLKILAGLADTGIGTCAVAKMLGLEFIPLIKESFDMALAQETFFREEVQHFIETLKSEDFRSMVSHLGNYDFTKSGKIIHTSG